MTKSSASLFLLVFFLSSQFIFSELESSHLESSHSEEEHKTCSLCILDSNPPNDLTHKISVSIPIDKNISFQKQSYFFKQDLFSLYLPRSPPLLS